MVGQQGKNSISVKKENRRKILIALMESPKKPLRFSEINRKLGFKNTTLARHLKNLRDEGVLKRDILDGKIVHVLINRKQTVVDLRKECWNDLLLLISKYGVCLSEDTRREFSKVAAALKESYLHPEEGADELFVGRLQIKIKKESEK